MSWALLEKSWVEVKAAARRQRKKKTLANSLAPDRAPAAAILPWPGEGH